MLFMPQDPAEREAVKTAFAKIVSDEGQTVLGWRDIPTDNSSLGKTAKAAEPFMMQVFIGRNPRIKDDLAFERKLYVIRKLAEQRIRYGGQNLPAENGFTFPACPTRRSFTKAC